jgi:hypothetical protein
MNMKDRVRQARAIADPDDPGMVDAGNIHRAAKRSFT